MNFLIIHGSYGNKDGNWFPWLKGELERLNHKVFLPQFPIGANKQNLENWTKKIDELNIDFDENLIIIAHSIGPAFVLSLLEKRKCRTCFFVSGFLTFLENKEYDKVNKTFVNKNFNWEKIKQNCSKFILYHGDNDPYVPLNKAKDFSKLIGVDLIVIPNGGHLNEESGYNEFNKLLINIKNELGMIK